MPKGHSVESLTIEGVARSPTTLLYTSYVLRVVTTDSLAEGLAALLPCFWVYQLIAHGVLARPYVSRMKGDAIPKRKSAEFSFSCRIVFFLTDRPLVCVLNLHRRNPPQDVSRDVAPFPQSIVPLRCRQPAPCPGVQLLKRREAAGATTSRSPQYGQALGWHPRVHI